MLLVGIGGGTASGKTSLSRSICRILRHVGVTLVPEDYYYKDFAKLGEVSSETNYDTATAKEIDLLRLDIERLKRGETIIRNEYNFKEHTYTNVEVQFEPSTIVIIEGTHCLNDRLLPLFDVSVFVSAAHHIRLPRRIRRDFYERDRPYDETVMQYISSVAPTHDVEIEKYRNSVDLIVEQKNTESDELFFKRAEEEIIAALFFVALSRNQAE